MAQAIGCDLCQQESAVMMQSNLGNGSTIAVGESCMVTFFASSLQAMLSGAPPEMLNDLSAVLAPLGAIIGPQEWDNPTAAEYPAPVKVHIEHDTGPREDGGVSVAAEGNQFYADGIPAHTQAEADQSEADHIAAEQSDAMMAEE